MITKLQKNIRSSMMKAIDTFDMIQDGDKILIGISGGKDSMLLAKMICGLRDFSHLKFKVKGVYIYSSHLMRCNVDFAKQENFFEEIGLDVEYVEIKLPEGAKLAEGIGVSCQWCAYARRITFFKLCEKRGYNKIALGHHMDDGITTLFMNMINNKRRALMPPINKMKRGTIKIIRPMSFVREHDIINLVKSLDIPVSPCTCPIGEKSRRKEIGDLMKMIEEREKSSIENMYYAAVKKFIHDFKDKDYVAE